MAHGWRGAEILPVFPKRSLKKDHDLLIFLPWVF